MDGWARAGQLLDAAEAGASSAGRAPPSLLVPGGQTGLLPSSLPDTERQLVDGCCRAFLCDTPGRQPTRCSVQYRARYVVCASMCSPAARCAAIRATRVPAYGTVLQRRSSVACQGRSANLRRFARCALEATLPLARAVTPPPGTAHPPPPLSGRPTAAACLLRRRPRRRTAPCASTRRPCTPPSSSHTHRHTNASIHLTVPGIWHPLIPPAVLFLACPFLPSCPLPSMPAFLLSRRLPPGPVLSSLSSLPSITTLFSPHLRFLPRHSLVSEPLPFSYLYPGPPALEPRPIDSHSLSALALYLPSAAPAAHAAATSRQQAASSRPTVVAR
ncbi:hypothetical protein CDD83_1637 [Cordyceps sp. RAO-2017]|nr:hypothetical protein CDD83_1637 [Cordyceps sp. RAO-2017]